MSKFQYALKCRENSKAAWSILSTYKHDGTSKSKIKAWEQASNDRFDWQQNCRDLDSHQFIIE